MHKKPVSILLLSILFLLTPPVIRAQQTYSEPFAPPLDIPLYLTGTFGELRTNHFHAGIDIKTQGREGHKVRAIEDGWVSRIKVSPGGYGKAIYITHPNGFVSVYGHLQRYNDSIQRFVKDIQYKRESFEIEVFPDKNEIPVKKGELIAYSGNTGGSEGPHLHFEIREEATQYSLNPLLFKTIKVKDFYRPQILSMSVYPVDSNSFVNGKQDTVFLDITGWGNQHKLKSPKTIKVSGRVSFGLVTQDLMNEIPNKNGVYEVRLLDDTTQLFCLMMDKLSFSTARYINSLIDYGAFQENRKRYIRTQIDTNNLLFNYQQVLSNGIYYFEDSLTHKLTWDVKDAYGNQALLPFEVQNDTAKATFVRRTLIKTPYFIQANAPASVKNKSLELTIPANAFYQSFYFDLRQFDTDSSKLSPVFKVHNNRIPIQKNLTLSILADENMLKSIDPQKLYLGYSPKNKNFYSVGGKMDHGRMVASILNLGYYQIMVDTLPPVIKPVNVLTKKDGKPLSRIKISIKDNQTGIASYRATLNGRWILMEYDAKNNLLFYEIDKRMKSGDNAFELMVKDHVGNQSTYRKIIIR
ncbi:MAG: M23 family metallopeptidase [Bacteroidales bacterium]|jgi:murein DD-endopeptidase MepM/ murein hydrolase activator NlpD